MSPSENKDRAAVHFPPPFAFLVLVLLGWVMHRWICPLPTPEIAAWWLPIAVGSMLITAGFTFILLSLRLFQRTGQKPEPWTSTPEIVSTGIYRHSRNPMYLGMALIQLGLGVALGNLWIIVLTPVAMTLVYLIAVRHEEAYLKEKFGQPYQRYLQTVRRWL
jgi:protein-S-isoprenylcysteine O-methyltransferase Ste14